MKISFPQIKRKPRKENVSQEVDPLSTDYFPSEHPKDNESSIIESELNKFRSEIQRKGKVTPRSKANQSQVSRRRKKSILIKLSSSSPSDEMEVKDPVNTPIETETEKSDSEEKSSGESTLPLTDPNNPTTVRFVDNIEVITYSRDDSTAPEDDYEDDFESLIEEEEDLFQLRHKNPFFDGVNYSERTVTRTTTTTTKFKEFYLLEGGLSSPNPSTTTTEEETTESSDLNFYQMFDTEEGGAKDFVEQEEKLTDSMTIKSLNQASNSEKSGQITETTEDLVQEIIRVKAVTNVANRHRILRKFLMKWMHYTTIQRITKDSNLTTKSQRMTKIDAYLKKIREQKKVAKQQEASNNEAKMNGSKDNAIVMMKRYHSKLKLQQDIIEVQKLKLERQERMIAELRLSRLNEDAKKFKQDLREELRNAMRTGDVRLRSKAKCLQVVGDVVEEEESKFVAYGSMIPRFLAKMQERALERQFRHEQAKERRIQLDAEKDAQRMAFEEDKVRYWKDIQCQSLYNSFVHFREKQMKRQNVNGCLNYKKSGDGKNWRNCERSRKGRSTWRTSRKRMHFTVVIYYVALAWID